MLVKKCLLFFERLSRYIQDYLFICSCSSLEFTYIPVTKGVLCVKQMKLAQLRVVCKRKIWNIWSKYLRYMNILSHGRGSWSVRTPSTQEWSVLSFIRFGSSGSGENIFKSQMLPLIFKKCWFPSSKNILCQVWWNVTLLFRRRRFQKRYGTWIEKNPQTNNL